MIRFMMDLRAHICGEWLSYPQDMIIWLTEILLDLQNRFFNTAEEYSSRVGSCRLLSAELLTPRPCPLVRPR